MPRRVNYKHFASILGVSFKKERLAAYPVKKFFFLAPTLLLPVSVYNSPAFTETYLSETLLQRAKAMLTCTPEKSPSRSNVRYLACALRSQTKHPPPTPRFNFQSAIHCLQSLPF